MNDAEKRTVRRAERESAEDLLDAARSDGGWSRTKKALGAHLAGTGSRTALGQAASAATVVGAAVTDGVQRQTSGSAKEVAGNMAATVGGTVATGMLLAQSGKTIGWALHATTLVITAAGTVTTGVGGVAAGVGARVGARMLLRAGIRGLGKINKVPGIGRLSKGVQRFLGNIDDGMVQADRVVTGGLFTAAEQAAWRTGAALVQRQGVGAALANGAQAAKTEVGASVAGRVVQKGVHTARKMRERLSHGSRKPPAKEAPPTIGTKGRPTKSRHQEQLERLNAEAAEKRARMGRLEGAARRNRIGQQVKGAALTGARFGWRGGLIASQFALQGLSGMLGTLGRATQSGLAGFGATTMQAARIAPASGPSEARLQESFSSAARYRSAAPPTRTAPAGPAESRPAPAPARRSSRDDDRGR